MIATLYYFPTSINRKWMGYVEHMGNITSAHKVLVGKLEGKTPVERCRHK
jgi:hypothetical protein